ncbi:hypothetical protein HJG54_09485 [Leptolyngbya sp. NK1-12]|uniref:Uncharacterized protein n=1 Tax=Leptolyngbya sp. NK1-12 TaxID=2547451 RepID=A0AA97AFE1_9CYAN|nr:hypothetical protein [Leptolyngbya sp. NK1-12]WNZ23070.1 hypothetical protein HJG54_09485 [Leptolyngbya sp. NK1-12]
MVLSASPPVYSSVSFLLDQLANELSQDQNLIRVKKLLLYVCTGTWESNQERLERLALRGLVQHLFEVAPTFEQFQHQINQAVATLNKAAEYTILANTIITRFHAVYAAVPQHRTVVTSPASYQAVAQQLAQEAEATRIKKLLLLTCRSIWENNATKLAQLNLAELVQELHQIAPTAETLRTILSQVASALSKPEEYRAIAELMSDRFQVLYQAAGAAAASSEASGWGPSTITELRQGIDIKGTEAKGTAHLSDSPLPATARADQQTAELSPRSLLRVVPNSSAVARTTEPQSSQVRTNLPARPPLRVLSFAQSQKAADRFNLRLEIMLDTNPLKAKILLFSLLHEAFQWNADHEAMLKVHELDDLLRILFVSYKLFSEAASKLKQIAQHLGAEDYFQVAEAIIRAIEPFYIEVLPAAVPLPAHTSADVTRMKTDTNEVTLPERH